MCEATHPMAVKRYVVPFESKEDECFELPVRYQMDEKEHGLGHGAYGAVAKAYDTKEERWVAVKKWKGLFDDMNPLLKKSAVRELKLLRHFSTMTKTEDGSHSNILRAYEIIVPLGNPEDDSLSYLERKKNFNVVYVVLDLYDMTLRQLMTSETKVTALYRCYFMFQVLHGLYAMFDAGCVHRDLKPENILIRPETASLALCDLGSGRGYQPTDTSLTAQSGTTTLFYRSPESFFESLVSDRPPSEDSNSNIYDLTRKTPVENPQALDMWSCGVILAELMNGDGKPLIESQNTDFHAIEAILSQVGVTGDDIDKFDLPKKEKEYFKSLVGQKLSNSVSLRQKYESKTDVSGEPYPEAEIDILEKMLQLHPAERISIANALNHEYFTSSELQFGSLDTAEIFTFRLKDDIDIRQVIWDEYMSCDQGAREFFEHLEKEAS